MGNDPRTATRNEPLAPETTNAVSPVDAPSPEPVPEQQVHAGHEGPPAPASPAVLAAGETVTPPEALSPSDEDLLLQASRIAEGLRARTSDITRREQNVAEQLASIDTERRAFRLTVEESRSEIEERSAKLDDRELELDDRLAACERTAEELREARDRLNADRDAYRADLEAEMEENRWLVDREAAALREERARVAAEAEEFREQRSRELDERKARLDAERLALREQIGSDLEAARLEFEAERTAWENERLEALAEIDREREINETAIRRAEETIAEQRSELDAARAGLEEELEERRTAFAAECEDERRRAREETHVEGARIRFQQEHLERVRHEVEAERNAHAHDRQRYAQQRERDELLLHLRRVQLDHYRQLLEERERSIERERNLVERAKLAGESETRRGLDRLVSERDAFAREREARLAELNRQQDVLTVHAQKLEERRQRLDELRGDLEETHRSTLELRLAIEEELARLSSVVGPDEASTRIDTAREALAEHYRHVREALNDQQREIDEARAALQLQREEFRDERHTMTEWISERDDALRGREDRLLREEEEFTSRESVWTEARGRWLREKIAAEEVIRDLLRQLTDFAADGAAETDAGDPAA